MQLKLPILLALALTLNTALHKITAERLYLRASPPLVVLNITTKGISMYELFIEVWTPQWSESP